MQIALVNSRIQRVLLSGLVLILFVTAVHGRPFLLDGLTVDLQDVTTNVDVYFTAMHYNRAANEWDVNVTVSNKTALSQSGPLVLVVDSFTGTSGPLQPDGVSSNQAYFDLSAQLPAGALLVGQATTARTIALGYSAGAEPQLVTSVFAASTGRKLAALAFTRSLDQVGLPLPGVGIMENGPDGTNSYTTDGTFAVVTMGNSAGNYVWEFSLAGYLPVWRQAQLQSNSIVVIPYPRLTATNAQSFALSPLTGGSLSNQTVQVQFAGGAFSQSTIGGLIGLDSQSLPGFLPQGWSPVQAFWLQFGSEPARAGSATLSPWGGVSYGETAALVQFNSASLSWQVLQLVGESGTNAVNVSVPGSGTYALVVPDSTPIAPPLAVVGATLSASSAATANPSNLVASAAVNPGTSAASTVPALVTGIATVSVTNVTGPLPSGQLLRGEVTEIFLLGDGTLRVPAVFDNYIVAYQQPTLAGPGALGAQFPVRPALLLGADQLNNATVHVDVFAPAGFNGTVFDTNGGFIGAGPVRLLAGPGVFGRQQGMELVADEVSNFAGFPGSNYPVAAAFEVAVNGVSNGVPLTLQASAVASNATFVLGQVIDQTGIYGVAPVERIHSDANGNLFSDEPTNTDHLPGLIGSGQYVLLQIAPEQGLVEGVAKNSSGQPEDGVQVSIAGQPWVTISAPDGSFKLLAPAGAETVSVTNLNTGDTGTQVVAVPTNMAPVITVVSTGVNPLEVASISPTDSATNVPTVSSVVVNFSHSIDPASFQTNSLELIEIGATNELVDASVTLDLADSTATLLPSTSLDQGAQFHVVLSTNIADDDGRPLSGQILFTFTTVPASIRNPAAELIIYQPGATNIPSALTNNLPGYVGGTNASDILVEGTPGCSDPGVPVIVADEATGQTTTVTSQPDGSFVTFVAGQQQDFISATFISLNGVRLYVPVNRQIFDDGSVGLYQQGGLLTSSGNGPAVQITVPPNAIQSRTVFKLVSVTPEELSEQLDDVMPTNGTVAGGALNLKMTGPGPTLPVQVSFPANLYNLGFPTNVDETNCAAVATVVQSNQNVTSFQIMGQLTFTPGGGPERLAHSGRVHKKGTQGSSQPVVGGGTGPVAQGGGDPDGALTALLSVTPLASDALGVVNQLIVPLLLGPFPVTVEGTVAYVPYADVFNVAQNSSGNLSATGQALQLVGVGNQLANASVIADYLLSSAELALSLPLSGAFVTITQADGPLSVDPGRIFPGMVYCTSGSDGSFLTVAPQAAANYLITASDPLFQYALTIPVTPASFTGGDLGLSGAVYKDFFFSVPARILTPPHISFANVPFQPATNQSCTVQVTAYQPTQAPTITVTLGIIGNTNLLTGHIITNTPIVTLGTSIITTNGTTTTSTSTLTCDSPVEVNVTVGVNGLNAATTLPLAQYPIDFRGVTPMAPGPIPPPPTNDVHGPVVVEVDPPNNGFIGQNDSITIIFNKPINPSVTNQLAGISLNGLPPDAAAPVPIVQLDPSQQVLQIEYPGLPPGGSYQLTLTGQSIQDLAGQPLNQSPGISTPVSFTTVFRTTPVTTQAIPLANGTSGLGRGAVISGTQLYVLDQGSQNSYLESFDISVPDQPVAEGKLRLTGQPRDLVVIPQYEYVTNVDQSEPYFTNDLVVVVGGDLTLNINTSQGTTVSDNGQYLWVVSMEDPSDPQVLASPIVTYRVGSVVPKIIWSPPNLIYQEYGPDIQQLVYVNLQALILGYSADQVQVDEYTNTVTDPGFTTNADGSYLSPGDQLPTPALGQTPGTQFYGYLQSVVLQRTTQPILDFSAANGGDILGVTLWTGSQLNSHNVATNTLPSMYRTLVFGAQLNVANPTDASISFGPSAYPRWVGVFFNVPVLITGTNSFRTLSLVSLAPDSDGVEKLAVIDISLPESPVLLNKIPIPSSLTGGDMQSIIMNSDGLIELSGTENLILLNPAQLAAPIPPGQLSPAIVGVIQGAGGIQRAQGTSPYGVHAVADSGHNVIVESPPQMQFVNFPQASAPIDPTLLHNRNDLWLAQLFSSMENPQGLSPARVQPVPSLGINSDLYPTPNVALHYYVLVQAPGGAGSSIDLGLEACNAAGWPLANLGQGFAPVRAVSTSTQQATGEVPTTGCGAAITPLKAYQVSHDPNSPYYNYYLSQPFALVTESMTPSDVTAYQANAGVNRQILFGGFQLRTFIDPDQANNYVIAPFAAQIDSTEQLIYPVSVAALPTVDRSYIDGDNPPPPGGAAMLPGTFDAICAHSGELRTDAMDISLPSPRMPIEIRREIGTQDTYNGPFGIGWDFNYNQRLTVLAPLTFPSGLQIPVVVRDTPTDSVTAGSQDILFHDGMGKTFIFKWISNSMPTEYAQDPLVEQFGYQNVVSSYYLPAPGQGVFDLMVQRTDGRFERLTPEGTLYRYTSQGRLESIYDRFQANFHWLSYDSHGWLTNITDQSVSAPRYLLLGHYRMQNAAGQVTDSDYNDSIDLLTTNALLNGKICQLQDYAGRSVLYQYSDNGLLITRQGVMVNGENGGFAGRSLVTYVYNGCQLVQVNVTSKGTPLISASQQMNSSGAPVTTGTTGVGSPASITVPLQNTAANLDGQASSILLADGSARQFTFNKWGGIASATLSGTNGMQATTLTTNSQEGLLVGMLHPEGNSETMTYDTNNPVFRSRGNMLTHAVNPGPRGGVGYSETFQYDPTYNLKSGAQTTPDGFTWTYTLTGDNRAIASITYGNSGTETFNYNNNGQVLSHADIRGVQASFTYDPSTGFILTRNLGDNTYTYNYRGDPASQLGQPGSVTLPAGAPLQLLYNANLQRVEITRGLLTEDMGYDEEGYKIYDQTQLGNGQVVVTHDTYDVKGFLLTRIMGGIEVDGNATSLEYDFTPDSLSRIQKVLYPEGTTETFAYDNRGNVTSMKLGDYAETYGYDLDNNLTNLIQGGDNVQMTTYNGLDRPITVIRQTGGQQEVQNTSYYPGGEVQSETLSDATFGEAQKQTVDQIDELGRSLHRTVTGTTITPTCQETYAAGSMTEAGPRMTTTRSWNSAGYDTGFTDPILTSVFHPDGNGNLTEADNQEDGATYNGFFTYDENDHRISESDDFGAQFLYLPRGDGSLLAVTNGNSHSTTFQQSALGEMLSKVRQDGLDFQFQHDDERHVSYSGDPSAGFHFAYDQDFRLTNSTLRNGSNVTYSQFNDQNMSQAMTFPGGNATMAYDLQQRMTNKTVSYQSTTYSFQQSYDAMDRPRVLTYQQDNATPNTATYTYDEAGPLLSAEFKEDGHDFKVQYGYYSDTTRQSVTYPSGVTVTETRDTAGRLTGLSDANGNIINASAWQGNEQPQKVLLGNTMQIFNTYDTRGRVTGSRATFNSGKVLTHLRYQYDAANNQQIRQFIHRNGKADQLSYDTGERLSQAKMGLTPPMGGPSLPLINRAYNYQQAGLDYLTSTTFSNLTQNIPIFATNWTSHDDFLLPEVVDGFNRSADPMGNVAQALLQTRPGGAAGTLPVSATLTNSGLGHLESIVLSNGITEQNFYQPSGLRYEKQILRGNQLLDLRQYVYDDKGRLLEEYQQTNAALNLVGRYYYANDVAPEAADLLDPGTGNLVRYYYLKDNLGSVLAVADANGNVIERVWYDPFGQPWIELKDTLAPMIQNVSESSDGHSYLIALTESVWATTNDPGNGGGIVPWPSVGTNIVTLSSNSVNIPGSVQLLPSVPGYPPYSVLQFTPVQSLPLSNGVTLTVSAGAVSDDSENTNGTLTMSFQATNQPGSVLYTNKSATSTAPVLAARSSVGSPFLFHGQYFDYDTGLIYLRARFYDPYSGMFLEPDPMGYGDSVNLYAAMGNNPIAFRDPTGLEGEALVTRFIIHVGEDAASETRATGRLVNETGRLAQTTERVSQDADSVVNAARRVMPWKSAAITEIESTRHVRLGIGKQLEKHLMENHLLGKGIASEDFMHMSRTAADDSVAEAIAESGPAERHLVQDEEGLQVKFEASKTQMHFELAGMDKHLSPDASIEQIVEAAKARARGARVAGLSRLELYQTGGASVTQWELVDIWNKKKLPYVNFYRDGIPLENPYVAPPKVNLRPTQWSAGGSSSWEDIFK